MTETTIDLPGVIAKSDDTDFLRELVQDAAQRLMDIEVAAVVGNFTSALLGKIKTALTARGMASAARTARTSATDIGQDSGIPGRAPSA